MAAKLLDGKAMAQTIQAEIAAEVADFVQNHATLPTLAAVLVGEDPASQVYVRNKQRACERAGIESRIHRLPAETTQDELLQLIGKLNEDDSVHGILIQLPLPNQIDEQEVLRAVSPRKDVDAFHPENVGLLMQGQPRFLPCTPHGIQQLLIRSGIETAGKHVVIIGRSDIVGKPMAAMMMQRAAGANATVTVCHSRTENLPEMAQTADILIVAIGRAKFVTADMVRPGAAVIDVGMNRTKEGLCGDVDFDAVREVAGYITPVPGGVGPLTVTMLLYNTLEAARQQVGS
ncbi:MAG: bifunctional methylenetetrahydrofolate dehydrogenase/methenyltetrahydrofolate cyclohydrolase FolD [Planctomycetes bacterium]|nr:bifunctional methylenetetrahydrofolate dehydrogenase/methenyltetrahydrofolate cyclohydrolase FolD [Planctomycetota bacterium]